MSEHLIAFFVLLVWLIVMTVIALVLRAIRGRRPPPEIELEEAQASSAPAELTHEEFERRRRSLGGRVA